MKAAVVMFMSAQGTSVAAFSLVTEVSGTRPATSFGGPFTSPYHSLSNTYYVPGTGGTVMEPEAAGSLGGR